MNNTYKRNKFISIFVVFASLAIALVVTAVCVWGSTAVQNWINVLSSLTTTAIGGFAAWLAYKEFSNRSDEIDRSTRGDLTEEKSSKDLKPTEGQSTAILVFQTSKQETTLVATDRGLECRLKRLSPELGPNKRQWRISKEDAEQIIADKNYSIDSTYKIRTGKFSIGPKTGWLYTKDIFDGPEHLENEILRLLTRVTNQ